MDVLAEAWQRDRGQEAPEGRRRGGGGSIIQVDGTARPKAPNLAREMDIKPQEA